MSTARRTTILQREGLNHAPPAVQRAFWVSRNSRRPGRMRRIGEIAAGLVTDGGMAAARRLHLVRAAWLEVVPKSYLATTEVEWLRRGRLRVRVTGKAAAFVLDRRLGPALVSALRERIPGARIDRIEFRVWNGQSH